LRHEVIEKITKTKMKEYVQKEGEYQAVIRYLGYYYKFLLTKEGMWEVAYTIKFKNLPFSPWWTARLIESLELPIKEINKLVQIKAYYPTIKHCRMWKKILIQIKEDGLIKEFVDLSKTYPFFPEEIEKIQKYLKTGKTLQGYLQEDRSKNEEWEKYLKFLKYYYNRKNRLPQNMYF